MDLRWEPEREYKECREQFPWSRQLRGEDAGGNNEDCRQSARRGMQGRNGLSQLDEARKEEKGI